MNEMLYPWCICATFADGTELNVSGDSEAECIELISELENRHGKCTWYGGRDDEFYKGGECVVCSEDTSKKEPIKAAKSFDNSWIGELALNAADAINEFQESVVGPPEWSEYLSEEEIKALDRARSILWDIYVDQHPTAGKAIASSTEIDTEGLTPYYVTVGLDMGGPEDGPIWRADYRVEWGESAEEVERRIDDEYFDYDGYEGCTVREATQEEVDDWNKGVEEAEKEYHWMVEKGYIDPEQVAAQQEWYEEQKRQRREERRRGDL